MTPLPERRKSAEEVAALRKSLGVPEDPAAGGGEAAEGAGESEERAKPEARETPRPETAGGSTGGDAAGEAEPAPVKSLRRAERLAPPRPLARARNDGTLPGRRHTEEELAALRKAAAPPPSGELPPTRLAANRVVVVLAYLFGVATPIVTRWATGDGTAAGLVGRFPWLEKLLYADHSQWWLFAIYSSGPVVMLATAAWIWLRRKQSTHHAGLMVILAVLVLVFGTLYFFPGLHGA